MSPFGYGVYLNRDVMKYMKEHLAKVIISFKSHHIVKRYGPSIGVEHITLCLKQTITKGMDISIDTFT